jgi:hypothetical protein
MKCWHCNTELSWGGDHNDEDGDGREMIVTNLSCPKCESFVLVYYTKKKRKKVISLNKSKSPFLF